MRYLYFPGCSLKGTGKAYEESLLAVFRALGVELREIEDWNCCGATAYMSVDEAKSYALAGRNLAIAEREGLDEQLERATSLIDGLRETALAMRMVPVSEIFERFHDVFAFNPAVNELILF